MKLIENRYWLSRMIAILVYGVQGKICGVQICGCCHSPRQPPVLTQKHFHASAC